MSVLHKGFSCDLVELEMVDFIIVPGIDWSHSSYASIDYGNQKGQISIPK